MKNLFLSPKSTSSDFTKIFIKLESIQKELRHQRVDLHNLQINLRLILDSIQETSPQTESTEQEVPEEEGI